MYLLLLLLNDVLTKLSAFFSEFLIYFFMKCDVSRGNWHKSTHVPTSFTTFHFIVSRRRKWHPTPVFLPGESHGRRSLVGCSPWVAKSRTRLSDFTFTFHFHTLEKEMATHSSVLAWRISGTEEPGGLPSLGSHRVGHDWNDLAAAAVAGHYYSREPTLGNIVLVIIWFLLIFASS